MCGFFCIIHDCEMLGKLSDQTVMCQSFFDRYKKKGECSIRHFMYVKDWRIVNVVRQEVRLLFSQFRQHCVRNEYWTPKWLIVMKHIRTFCTDKLVTLVEGRTVHLFVTNYRRGKHTWDNSIFAFLNENTTKKSSVWDQYFVNDLLQSNR